MATSQPLDLLSLYAEWKETIVPQPKQNKLKGPTLLDFLARKGLLTTLAYEDICKLMAMFAVDLANSLVATLDQAEPVDPIWLICNTMDYASRMIKDLTPQSEISVEDIAKTAERADDYHKALKAAPVHFFQRMFPNAEPDMSKHPVQMLEEMLDCMSKDQDDKNSSEGETVH